MPVHDWTKVPAGIFHHFHQDWTIEIARTLNRGVLPAGYYAMAEQVAGGPVPDVVSFQHIPKDAPRPAGNGNPSAATEPPRARFIRTAEPELYAAKANRIAVRHPLGEVVAVLEIVSPGNKESRHALRAFVAKAVEFLHHGIHLLIVDLLPPTPRDPQGIHKAIWDEICDEPFELPTDKPLTLVSYAASPVKTAYIEPVAVGDVLPEMSLFLAPGMHVLVPLESTYQTTWSACPEPMKTLLQA